jgi:hypothetical protein
MHPIGAAFVYWVGKPIAQPLKQAERFADIEFISILPSTTAGSRFLSREPAVFCPQAPTFS